MNDEQILQEALALARQARAQGNHPFGALLADTQGNILLRAENSVVTGRDCTGHAETNLMRLATQAYDADFLATCTLYTSTEPCAMCAGAIFWGNVRRVVFGLRESKLYELVDAQEQGAEVLFLPCREVFAKGNKTIEVVGPLLEEEAALVHEGFWQ